MSVRRGDDTEIGDSDLVSVGRQQSTIVRWELRDEAEEARH